jgi:hypothetical protein
MAKQKYDGVIEAVHYEPDGMIKWARVYLRRGSVFTDRILLDRQRLLSDLKAGKNYLVGQRVVGLGSVFEVTKPLRVEQINAQEVITTAEALPHQDNIVNVPVI